MSTVLRYVRSFQDPGHDRAPLGTLGALALLMSTDSCAGPGSQHSVDAAAGAAAPLHHAAALHGALPAAACPAGARAAHARARRAARHLPLRVLSLLHVPLPHGRHAGDVPRVPCTGACSSHGRAAGKALSVFVLPAFLTQGRRVLSALPYLEFHAQAHTAAMAALQVIDSACTLCLCDSRTA